MLSLLVRNIGANHLLLTPSLFRMIFAIDVIVQSRSLTCILVSIKELNKVLWEDLGEIIIINFDNYLLYTAHVKCGIW